MSKIYRNKLVINQRGGSIVIDNTTDSESVQISQRNGNNILLNNLVNSELATNNKQLNVVNDSFETVGNDKTVFVNGVNTTRTGNTSYGLHGFTDQSELDAVNEWKITYAPIAILNSKFPIKRGGETYPNGTGVDISGTRMNNPVVGSSVHTVENKFHGYSGVPTRSMALDEVTQYVKVLDYGHTTPASEKKVTVNDVEVGAGSQGSSAPGVLEFGANKSAATENGQWDEDSEVSQLPEKILKLQPTLTQIEQSMGDGGDYIKFHKRNKFTTIGATFNDFPSVKIDEKGRSQPLEVVVGETGAFKNHDYVPHVEDVDNSSAFPGGNDVAVICNSYTRNVGSGGISWKTTGPMELGGTSFKAGFKVINMNASHGISIGSESFVEIQSLKTIALRTNRQVLVDCALGVNKNAIVKGGVYVEGETYLQHVTAPLEVQQTENTKLLGKFATDKPRVLPIGECEVGGVWYPVYAYPTNDLILTPPHSHHFNNLPLRLTQANKDVRKFAQKENINNHANISQSLAQNHEHKSAQSAG